MEALWLCGFDARPPWWAVLPGSRRERAGLIVTQDPADPALADKQDNYKYMILLNSRSALLIPGVTLYSPLHEIGDKLGLCTPRGFRTALDGANNTEGAASQSPAAADQESS